MEVIADIQEFMGYQMDLLQVPQVVLVMQLVLNQSMKIQPLFIHSQLIKQLHGQSVVVLIPRSSQLTHPVVH